MNEDFAIISSISIRNVRLRAMQATRKVPDGHRIRIFCLDVSRVRPAHSHIKKNVRIFVSGLAFSRAWG